jgi:aryl-alcohol dehydrogenase-like predicted oxidoreductase
VLAGIAKKHGTSISNVATKWVLSRPAVPAVIVGARNANHVADHQQLFAFELDADDQAALADILKRGRQSTSDCYAWERGMSSW